MIWADYFEQRKVPYAFFSAADAAALQEQAEKQRRRAEGEDEVDDEDGGDVEGHEELAEVSGEEVEVEEDLSKPLASTSLDEDYEEGWSTEGEDDEDEETAEVEKRLENGERLPLREAAQQVAREYEDGGEEDIRTRVLSVTELEDLFQSAAPDLQRTF